MHMHTHLKRIWKHGNKYRSSSSSTCCSFSQLSTSVPHQQCLWIFVKSFFSPSFFFYFACRTAWTFWCSSVPPKGFFRIVCALKCLNWTFRHFECLGNVLKTTLIKYRKGQQRLQNRNPNTGQLIYCFHIWGIESLKRNLERIKSLESFDKSHSHSLGVIICLIWYEHKHSKHIL